ncbi:Tim17/Tim22/Tim23/Pmp24 family-domain-containing protein [Daldinia sp. FL1419]|nr:Tim17/Tim22/Tim23/Pmp24 family-domain-containing protein [Daldinia sp. FL1419]
MSIWDALTGRKSSSSTQSSSTTSTSAPAPTENLAPTPFNPEDAQGVDSFLKSSAFADPSLLHPLAGLDKDSLEYLSLEDSALSDLPGAQSAIPSRGFSDDLCYGTGITYLTALSIGGIWGLQEGLRRSAGQPPKLRLNSVLNAVTRRGPFLGNSAGVVAITYNCFNSGIGYIRGKHDSANTIAAGTLSGMLFKSTRGIRPMLISGGIVGSIAGAWAEAAQRIKNELIDSRIQAWLSNGVYVKSLEEVFTLQLQLGKTDTNQSIALNEKNGYLLLTLDDTPPKDPEALWQLQRLGDLVKNKELLARAIDKLLDKEIDERALLAFESESILDVSPPSTLSFHDKVHLIAKHRLLEHELKSPPKPLHKVTPKHELNIEPQVEMCMLRVTAMMSLHLESFLAPLSPEYCVDCFHALLEEVAEPYLSAGISNRKLLDYNLYGTPGDDGTGPLTKEEEEEWYKELRLEISLSHEQLASWSYRLSDPPGDHSKMSAKLYTNWLPVDTQEQYERMSSLIKEHKLSAVFIRTWKIGEARRVAQRTEAKGEPLQQDGLSHDSSKDEHLAEDTSSQEGPSTKTGSLPQDEEKDLQDFGQIIVDIFSKSKLQRQ